LTTAKKILRVGTIISIILIVIGLVLLLPNAERLSSADAFGGNTDSYLRGKSYTLRSTYELIGDKYIIEDGNIAFGGLMLIISGGVAFLVSYLLSNNSKMIENSESQVELLRNMEKNTQPYHTQNEAEIAGKLKQLESLYEQKIITKEEYQAKRKDILDQI